MVEGARASTNGSTARTPTAAIVGGGMSGVAMGVALKRVGIESFTIYERADEVGGTWRANTYPGLRCDIMSRNYQYTFDPNDWSQWFSPGAEIREYFQAVADRQGIIPHVEFGTEIARARFDGGCWHVETKDGEQSHVDFLILATGFLTEPRYPEIEGLHDFEGPVFHSARWEHQHDLDGRRVAVIGTGSTGVQLVGALAERVSRLVHFVRTPQWIAPFPNKRYSRPVRAAMRRFPALNAVAYRGAQTILERTFGTAVVQPGWQRRFLDWVIRRNLRQVEDPELRRKLTPDYQPMCKRLVVSPYYYDAVQRDHVDVVREDIERVESTGVRTADGTLHEVDALVLATGYHAHRFMRPMELVGEGGLTLEEAWQGPKTYRTVTIPGFPNLFMILGPNSPFGNISLTTVAEDQVAYIMRWIEMWRAGRVSTMAPTPEAAERFDRLLDREVPTTIFATGCNTYQLDENGRPFLWPDTPQAFREILGDPAMEDFEVTPGPAVSNGAAAMPATRSG